MRQFTLTSILIAIVATMMLYLSACSDDECTELKTENLFTNPIVYNGNQTIKFLHNQTDTHVFYFYNKENYYTPPTRGGNEGDCPTQYQAVKIYIQNTTMGNQFLFQFERDENIFSRKPNPNATGYEYMYYKFSGINCFFYKQITYSGKDSINILGKKYAYVHKIGGDSLNNFIYYNNQGILSIKIKGETWDLLPN